MNTGFVKLSCGIVNSSIRTESYPTRLMWYNMLEMADFNGNVFSSISGLSRSANITIDETRAALEVFLSPDPDSRSKEFDGRRIVEIDGGWSILNYRKYREFSYSMNPEAVRKRAYRSKKKGGTCQDTNGHVPKTSGHSASASASASVSASVSSDILTNIKNKKENIKHIKEKILWRQKTDAGFQEYKRMAKEAFDRYKNDWNWILTMKRFYPGVDIRTTLDKMFFEFWGIEAGWENKRAKHSEKIDWERTIKNNFKKSRVFFPKDEPDTELQEYHHLTENDNPFQDW